MQHPVLKYLAVSVLLALAACGGGGGSGSGSASGINITVATGAPVEGASVVVVDASGNSETCSGTTNASGVVNCALSTAKTAPYFIRANKGSTSLYAVLPETGSNLNITPISDVMAKKYAAENSVTPEQLIAQPTLMASSDKSKANDAVTLVNAIVRAIAAAAGVTNISNPLTQSYTATSTDQMDKFIQNIQLNTDSTGINFSIPTSTGAVAISIAYTASTTAASSTVNAKSAQLASASFTDGDKIDALIGVMMGKLPTCKNNAGEQATMVSLIEAKNYSGVKYHQGRTTAEWVARVCDIQLPGMKKVFSKTLARFGNRIIFTFGAKPANGAEGNIELAWAAIKTGDANFQASDAYGGWRIMADNLPVNFALKTRHALSYDIKDSNNGGTKIKYERYLDAWAGKSDGTVTDPTKVPDTIEFYAIPLKTMAEKYISASDAATYFATLSPTFTMYKTDPVVNGVGCTTWFTLDPTKQNCEFFLKDNRSQGLTDLFTTLQDNEYTLLVMKGITNNVCTNCDANAIPMSYEVLGKAYTVSQLFGSAATSLDLVNGVSMSQFASAMTNARNYFGAPAAAELVAMESKLLGSSMGGTFNVMWQRSNDKRKLDGVWGGWNSCGGGPWTELNQPDDTTLLPNDSYTFNTPSGKSNFNQARYLSFTFANQINMTEFAFYVNAHRDDFCSQ